MTRFALRRCLMLSALAIVPLVAMGADGTRSGCGGIHDPGIPDATGEWAIDYDDTLTVEITLGDAVYAEEIGLAGGAITIEHEGQPLTFDLDCARPEVLCPSEAWPSTVSLLQKPDGIDALVEVTLPFQRCEGAEVEPDPATCGPGTHNPDCDAICDGELVVEEAVTGGIITDEGTKLSVFLGAGVASNGVHCALLGLSAATATLNTIGSEERDTLEATHMEDGVVAAGYAGGCLWAGDPDDDGSLEALVLAASVVFKTGFTGVRTDFQ